MPAGVMSASTDHAGTDNTTVAVHHEDACTKQISGQIIFNNKVGGCEINVLTGVVPAYSSRGYITLLSEQNFLLSGVLVLLLLLGV